MASLDEMVSFLDHELNTSRIADYSGAVNGLQLANSGVVERVVSAVDASLATIKAAAEGGPGLLVVHHGMFWQGLQPVTGAFYEKLKIALDAELAIYSSHLPLDVHPQWGNNVLLADAIGMKCSEPFLESKGMAMGVQGGWTGTRTELIQRLESILSGPVHFAPGGPEQIQKIGIVTGGAGSEVAKAAAAGVDTFITGEGPHWSYPLAEELRINLIYAGHYATETFGVKKLGQVLSDRFQVSERFLHFPTGL